MSAWPEWDTEAAKVRAAIAENENRRLRDTLRSLIAAGRRFHSAVEVNR